MKILAVAIMILACSILMAQKFQPKPMATNSAAADTTFIFNHLAAITKTKGYRNHLNVALLNEVAAYIYTTFEQYADTVHYQEYEVSGNVYKNVVCRFGSHIKKPLIVVGAHYDVCGNQEGADDNASGVVGILELARMLQSKPITHPIELVAYTLEEPPYFRTPYMGSYVHAKSLKDSGTPVYGMLALEMIGYFSDEPRSQDYPVKALKVAYGRTGDYIMLAKQTGSGKFVKSFSRAFKHMATLETKSFKAPSKVAGLDFSDHRNYWAFEYDALMITNTAFYRNKNYHEQTDTMETLDLDRMAKVITGIYEALLKM